jgi:hypothetical protein
MRWTERGGLSLSNIPRGELREKFEIGCQQQDPGYTKSLESVSGESSDGHKNERAQRELTVCISSSSFQKIIMEYASFNQHHHDQHNNQEGLEVGFPEDFLRGTATEDNLTSYNCGSTTAVDTYSNDPFADAPLDEASAMSEDPPSLASQAAAATAFAFHARGPPTPPEAQAIAATVRASRPPTRDVSPDPEDDVHPRHNNDNNNVGRHDLPFQVHSNASAVESSMSTRGGGDGATGAAAAAAGESLEGGGSSLGTTGMFSDEDLGAPNIGPPEDNHTIPPPNDIREWLEATEDATSVLHERYYNKHHRVQSLKKQFVCWYEGPPRVPPTFGAVFVCPLSGEAFIAGELSPIHRLGRGTSSYSIKNMAKKAAAGRAEDCFRLRESERGARIALFCRDRPYTERYASPTDRLLDEAQVPGAARIEIENLQARAVAQTHR